MRILKMKLLIYYINIERIIFYNYYILIIKWDQE